MKILVTGASGFVGGAVWRAAREAGHEVLGLGRRPLAEKDYVSCDLSHGMDIDFAPDAVVHAAARSSPWGSRREFEAQNVTATKHVLDFCERRGRPHLVHVSTAAVMYTNSHQLDLDETSPLPRTPVNRYAASKREAESMVMSYAGRWSIVRPRAVFGPGDTVVFPRVLRLARSGRLPLLESEKPIVGDLIYIETLADYILQLVERRIAGLFLLTNNRPVPMVEFLATVLAQLGLPPMRRHIPVGRAMAAASLAELVYALLPFLGEPPLTRYGVGVFAYSKTFNVKKALRDLGPPSVSLDDGVDRFVRWQRNRSS